MTPEKQLSILHVVPYAMDRHGGVQAHARDLCAWLTAQGHSAAVIAPMGPHGAVADVIHIGRARTISVHGTGSEIAWADRTERGRLDRVLADRQPDLLHLHTPWVPALPIQVWRRATCPTVATYHATLPEPPTDIFSRVFQKVAKAQISRLAATLVPSEVPLTQWRKAGITPLPGILPPCIDLAAWRAAGDGRASPSGPARRVICVGRIEGRKGVDTVIAAWPLIRAALPDLTLQLVGRGADAARLPDGVEPVGDADDTTLRRLVAKADLFIAPARFGESFGLVLAEAMAAGTPIVAAGNAAYRSVIGPEADMVCFPPGDAEALAARVIALCEDPAMRAAFAAWGRARAGIADVAQVGPDYVALYRDVLAGCSNRDG